jgi:cobalt-zinc-cadmium efflux system outer membrane protein
MIGPPRNRVFVAMAIMVSILVCNGCRGRRWCSLGALGCLPDTADRSSQEYWERCGSPSSVQPTSNASAVNIEQPASTDVDDPLHSSSRITRAAGIPAQTVAYAREYSSQENAQDTPPSSNEPSPDARDVQDGEPPNPFQLPSVLPGADAPPLRLPPMSAMPQDGQDTDRQLALQRMFRPPIALPSVPDADPELNDGIYGLDELQLLARDNNPRIRAAAAAVETARGLMIQAGLPPNPNMGYQSDTVRTAFTPGYKGAYIEQTFITARKLGLAAEAAAVDHANAYLDLRRTWYTVISEVRRQYFNTLAARRRLQLAQGLLELSERAYQVQIDLVKAGEAAPYEPLQLQVLTTQARATAIAAQQESLAAWRMLAAAIGIPALDPMAIDGHIDCPVPDVNYENAVSRMLAVHTDIRVARNLVGKERTLVVLADRTPIPNLDVGVVIQRDFTFQPRTTTYNLNVGGAIPVWNRNQGNRIAKRADLTQASQNVLETQNRLMSELAPVYGEYQSNRQLASSYRTDALVEQVQAYRGIQERYRSDPSGIAFNDIVVAQQILANTLTQYVNILQSQWQGTVNLAELLQVDDIFQMGPPVPVAEIPELIETEDVPTPAEVNP